jgi:hypothetical protein
MYLDYNTLLYYSNTTNIISHEETTQIDDTIQDAVIPINNQDDVAVSPTHVSALASNDVPQENNSNLRRSTSIQARQMQSIAKQLTIHDIPANHEYGETMSKPMEPCSYQEAISCPDAKQWIQAIQEEHESLVRNKTWTICQLPFGRKAIEGKWILKYKPRFKTTAPRYKARFVIKGFSQVQGVDYNETYAPVAKTYSFRMVMAIAAARDLEMIQLDVNTAFLYGTLEEEVYMHQPESFVLPGREEEVCRLIKSTYWLKQASRVWNVKFNEFIISFGLTRSECDSCIYYRHLRQGEKDKEITFFILYVDDGLILSNVNQVLLNMMEFLVGWPGRRHASASAM